MKITGSRPIQEAIVTAGGVSTDEINPLQWNQNNKRTLFCGEVIDVDAYTGALT